MACPAWYGRGTEPEISYAKSRGLSVAYSVRGDGPIDLVVVPGFVSHLEAAFRQPAIARFMRRLGSFARVIVFDKAGTGLSDPTDGATTLEERMDDLTAVLDAVGSDHVALFGVSEGAPMCALFAASHPDRARALVMYGSYAKGVAAEDYPWAPTQAQVDLGSEMIEEEWGGECSSTSTPPASPATPISVPTLVLHRSGDLLWPVEGAEFVSEQIDDASFVVCEGIDHFPFVGDSDALLSEVEAFVVGADFDFEPRGPHALKGVPGDWELFSV